MHTNIELHALRRAAEILGSQSAVARACGYESRRNVWPWFNRDQKVPPAACPLIELATTGLVLCEELRTDIAWVRVPDDAWPVSTGRPCINVAPDLPSPAEQEKSHA